MSGTTSWKTTANGCSLPSYQMLRVYNITKSLNQVIAISDFC